MDMLNVQNLQNPMSPGLWTKFLVKIAALNEDTLKLCPTQDWDNARSVGQLMIFTWQYQTALFIIISHRLFAPAGHIRPELVIVSMFLATFILLIDSYMIMRSGWHHSGLSELKRGGIDISGGSGPRIKAGIFLAIRIALSVGLAQLTAIFVSLLIFAPDIDARIQKTYQGANAHLISEATTRVDDDLKRATDAVTAQTARVTALSGQLSAVRQNEIDPSLNDPAIQQAQQEVSQLVTQKAKADEDVRTAETFATNEFGGIKGAATNSGEPGRGPRYAAAMQQVANAKSRAQEVAKALDIARTRLDALRQQAPAATDAIKQRSDNQLPVFQSALDAESAKLASLKDELNSLTQRREEAIRRAVDSAPDHVEADAGFLSQIKVLEQIAQDNSKVAALIILIDFVSFGFELAAVLAKVTSYVPTTYATLIARDAYMQAVRTAEAMMAELRVMDDRDQDESPPLVPASEPGPSGSSNGSAPPPPKRGRGRPRKDSQPAPLSTARSVTGAIQPEDQQPRPN